MAYGFSAFGFSWHGFSTDSSSVGPNYWFRSPWFGSAHFASAWWGLLVEVGGSPVGSPSEPPVEPPLFVTSGPGYRIVLPVSLQRLRLEDDELFVFLVGSMLTQGLLK